MQQQISKSLLIVGPWLTIFLHTRRVSINLPERNKRPQKLSTALATICNPTLPFFSRVRGGNVTPAINRLQSTEVTSLPRIAPAAINIVTDDGLFNFAMVFFQQTDGERILMGWVLSVIFC